MHTSSVTKLMGSNQETKKKADQGNPEEFSGALEDAKDQEQAKKAEDKKEQAKQQVKKEEQKTQQKVADRSTKNQKKTTNLQQYVQNLKTKDPAKLSVAEKQMLQVAEFSKEGNLSTSGAKALLASQGFPVEKLSEKQMEQLKDNLLSGLDKAAEKSLKGEHGGRLEDNLLALMSQSQEQPIDDKQAFSNFLQDAGQSIREAAEQSADRALERKQVIDKILNHIEVRNLSQSTEMNLRLNPEYLGELKVQLVQGDKGVEARFKTTSRVTREMLEETQDELREKIGNKGIALSGLQVDLVDELY